MQTTAIGTVANSLPENEVILLTLLISKGYILFAELRNIFENPVSGPPGLRFRAGPRAAAPRCFPLLPVAPRRSPLFPATGPSGARPALSHRDVPSRFPRRICLFGFHALYLPSKG